jgi:hypothetical protein
MVVEQEPAVAPARSTGLISQRIVGAQRVNAPPRTGIKETGEWRLRCVRLVATASVTAVDTKLASRGDLSMSRRRV